jgi:hypothetical protein
VTETEVRPAEHAHERSRFGSLGSIVGLLSLTWGAGLASAPLDDNSFFTHLATGRIILGDGRVPTTDPYTFTAAGEAWTVQSWLASVAYAGFERLGGTAGIRVLVLVLFLGATWVLWRLTRPITSVIVRLAVMSGAMAVASGLWSERPYMVGVIGLGLVWLALDAEVPWWVLLPAMWVWGNAHGSFILALVLVALILFGGALDRGRARWTEVPAHESRAAAAVLVGTLLVAVGPLGPRALTFPFVAARRSDVFRHVTEWQSPEFRSPSELAFLVFASAAILVLVLGRRRPSWRVALPAVAFLGSALYAQRNVVMATVVLVAALSAAAPVVGTLRITDRPSLGRPIAMAVALLLVLVSVVTVLAPARAGSGYAVRAVAWVGLDGFGQQRVATDVLDGNLLTLLAGPAGVVFADDRFDMVPDQVFEDLLDLRSARPGWSHVLDEHQIDAVVWSGSGALSSVLRADTRWQVIYADSTSLVACRRGSDCRRG